VLARNGQQDLCFKLITQKSFPSYDEYENINGKLMRKDGVDRIPSFNHHFWGGVLAWIYRYIGWLNVKSADVVEICPTLFDGVNQAEISYSRNGKSISVKWGKVSEHIRLIVKNQGFVCLFKYNGQEEFLNGDCEFFID